jgi:putative aldouronate transport system permease protein
MDVPVTGKKPLIARLRKQTTIQIMALFGLSFLFFFRILPIYGLQLAFKELLPGQSIQTSPWVGLKHFENFFYSGDFGKVMYNTLTLSLARIILGFRYPLFSPFC